MHSIVNVFDAIELATQNGLNGNFKAYFISIYILYKYISILYHNKDLKKKKDTRVHCLISFVESTRIGKLICGDRSQNSDSSF